MPLTVSVWSGVPLSRSLPPTCLFARLQRPALCSPHASRIVWPAFTPACTPALALALAPAPERPARPRLGAACVRSDCRLPIPGRPRACLPRLPARLPPFPPVSPERGGASLSPRRLIDFRLGKGWPRLGKVWPQISRPSRVFSSDGGAVGRCPLHARACHVWGLGCRHRRRQPVRDRS